MGEVTSPPQVVPLADYRRDTWSAADAAWEQAATSAVAALTRGERLRATLLLPRAEAVTRQGLPADDPRRAASLTLLARWQLGLGNRAQAARVLVDAADAWTAADAWVARLRPAGPDPAALAECRRLLGSALALTAALAADGPEEPAGLRPGPSLEVLARLAPDRRKLVAAVALATARLRPFSASADGGGVASGRATLP